MNTTEENQTPFNNAVYTLGVNSDGMIQMRFGTTDYGSSTTLSMNHQGVITLIEDLAHYVRHKVAIDIRELPNG